MSDAHHDPFAAFDELTYPGKREPANRPKPEVSAPPERHWSDRPVIYIYDGQSREFFTISHLSEALNRASVTIRGWENKGLLPKTPFRSPAPRRSTLTTGAPKGKRLWTRAQIEGILRIAEETGCIVDEAQSPPNAQFTAQVTRLFVQLLEAEKKST